MTVQTESYSDDLTSVTVRKETPDQKAGISLVERQGTVFVTKISENGLFHESGINAGDIVLSINGTRMRKGDEGPDELIKAIKKAQEKVTVVVKKASVKATKGSRSLSPRTLRRMKNKTARQSYKRDSMKYNADGSLNLSYNDPSKWDVDSDDGDNLLEQVTVEAKKMFSDQSVGLSFKEKDNMLFVTEISRDSPFYDNELEVGDRIMSINGMSFVRYADAKYATKILSKTESKITLVLERGHSDVPKKKTKKKKASDKNWKSTSDALTLSKGNDESIGDIKAHLEKLSTNDKEDDSSSSSSESTPIERDSDNSDGSIDILDVDQKQKEKPKKSKSSQSASTSDSATKPRGRSVEAKKKANDKKAPPPPPPSQVPASLKRSSKVSRPDEANLNSIGSLQSKEKMMESFNRSLGALSPSGQDRVKKGVRALSTTSSPTLKKGNRESFKSRKSTGSIPGSPGLSPRKSTGSIPGSPGMSPKSRKSTGSIPGSPGMSPSSTKGRMSSSKSNCGHDYIRVKVRKELGSDIKVVMRGEKYFIESLPKHESRVSVGDEVLAINGVTNIYSARDLIEERKESVTLTVLFEKAKEMTCPCCGKALTCNGQHVHEALADDSDHSSATNELAGELLDDMSERTTRTANLRRDKPKHGKMAAESIPEGSNFSGHDSD